MYIVFDTSLTWQYRIAIGKMGLTKRNICNSIYNSVEAAYIDEQEKIVLRKMIDDYLNVALSDTKP